MTLDARTASACARPTAHPLLNRQILRGLVIWEFVPATVAPTWPNVTCNVLRAITALCWRYFTQDPAQLLRPISSWPLRTIMTRLAPCPRHLTICLLENVTATSKVEGFSSPPPPQITDLFIVLVDFPYLWKIGAYYSIHVIIIYRVCGWSLWSSDITVSMPGWCRRQELRSMSLGILGYSLCWKKRQWLRT